MALGESDRHQLDPPPSTRLRYRRARSRLTHLPNCRCARAQRVRQPPVEAALGITQLSAAIPPPRAAVDCAPASMGNARKFCK